VKLINRTKCPDAALLLLLRSAASAMPRRVRTGKVVVRVTQGRWTHSAGITYEADSVRWGKDRSWLRTDMACFSITLPHPKWAGPPVCKSGLDLAAAVWKTARHEWFHVHEEQSQARYKLAFATRSAGGRRCAWRYRPEEMRAMDVETESDRLGRTADAAIDDLMPLALWYEQQGGSI
jgi:hypothetical protein